MNRTILAATAATALALSACQSGAPESTAEQAPAPVTVTVTAAPTNAEPDTETASQTQGAAEATPASPTSEEPSEAATDAAPAQESDADFAEPTINDRGNLVKVVGQLAGIRDEDGNALAQFTLTDIQSDFECTSEYSEPSENGHYLALTFDVETFKELADDEWFNTFTMNEMEFTVFDTDGKRENDSTGNAWMCLADNDRLPSEIGPSEKVTGMVVLDTAIKEGSVVFSTYGSDGAVHGWEWNFPQP